MQRRSFIAGILGAAAAPAIVKADSLMKLWVPEKQVWHTGGFRTWALNSTYGKLSSTTQYSSARVAPLVEWDDLMERNMRVARFERQLLDQMSFPPPVDLTTQRKF